MRKEGTVIAKSSDKTIKVRVTRLTKHPVVGKYIKKSRNYLVHDPEEKCSVNDRVFIVPGLKVSKQKSWHLSSDSDVKAGDKS